ncbi:hypothetical protein CK934_20065 [Chitinophaga sp. MD30]|nr:hypothetical protein CK934_20065 [Chitinophaga sp. MD30]
MFNMDYRSIILLEARQFLRGRTILVVLVSVFILGCYGLYHGRQVRDHQETVISAIPTIEQEHTAKNISYNAGKPVGGPLYYQYFYTTNPPTPWAAFAIGQRDVNPYHLKVKMLAIEGQLYDTDLSNPVTLLAGNLDVAFVFVFLLPLVMIVFCYNTLSGEEESGVWKIVRSMPISPVRLLAMKLAVRFLTLLVLAVFLFFTAHVWLGLPVGLTSLYMGLVLFLYLLCWFSIIAWVITWQRSSGMNAVILVSIWIGLTILLPGLANTLLNSAIPVPESFETTVAQRQGYHEKWDRPVMETMERFYQVYPQYRNYPFSKDTFSYAWYYAMQLQGDEAAVHSSKTLFDKLGQRQLWANRVGYLLPTINAQQQLNHLARTDLADHISYLTAVKDYHREVREYFYPYIFRHQVTEQADWLHMPVFRPKVFAAVTLPYSSLLSLFVFTIVCGGLGWRRSRRLFVQGS